MRTRSPRLTLTRRSAVSTLPPLTRAWISVPANPAVVVVVGPAVEVGLLVAEPLVLAAWPPPSSPPQPATSQQASSRPATTRRGTPSTPPCRPGTRWPQASGLWNGDGSATIMGGAGSVLRRPAGGRVGREVPARCGWSL